jgi:hypothetical protein
MDLDKLNPPKKQTKRPTNRPLLFLSILYLAYVTVNCTVGPAGGKTSLNILVFGVQLSAGPQPRNRLTLKQSFANIKMLRLVYIVTRKIK